MVTGDTPFFGITLYQYVASIMVHWFLAAILLMLLWLLSAIMLRDGTSLSVHFHETIQILRRRSNSPLKSGQSMWSAAHTWAPRNCTVPACVMRTLPSALIASYPSSKSFHVTHTLTLADSSDSVWILIDPTQQHTCVSPFMVIILTLLLLQVGHSLALTMVRKQPESSAEQGIWSTCTWMIGCALFTSCLGE